MFLVADESFWYKFIACNMSIYSTCVKDWKPCDTKEFSLAWTQMEYMAAQPECFVQCNFCLVRLWLDSI